MPGISIHVVDVSRGVLCDGMEIALYALDAGGGQKLIAEGKIGRSGLLESGALRALRRGPLSRGVPDWKILQEDRNDCRWCRSSTW